MLCQHKALVSQQHIVVQPLYWSTQLNDGTKPCLELMISKFIRFVGQLSPKHLISTEYIVQACTSCCLLEAGEYVSSRSSETASMLYNTAGIFYLQYFIYQSFLLRDARSRVGWWRAYVLHDCVARPFVCSPLCVRLQVQVSHG